MSHYQSPRHISHRLSMVIAALLILLLASCGGTASRPATLPFSTINLGLPAAALDAPVIGSLPDNALLHVSITFKLNQRLLDRLNTPFVRSEQGQDVEGLADQLGISNQDYQKIKAFFGIEHASLSLNKLHTNLTVEARASTFARLFQTHFVLRRLNGRTFFTPATDAPPRLPSFIASRIEAITGLDNYSLPPRTALSSAVEQELGQPVHRSAPDCSFRTQKGNRLLVPGQVAQAYGYDQFYRAGLHGENMTVNLLEFQTVEPADVQNYFSCVHYHGRLRLINVYGSPKPAAGPFSEATLDVEMIAGLAPAANIVSYQVDLSDIQTFDDYWTRFNDGLQRMIDDNTHNGGSGSVVSISYGLTEEYITHSELAAIDQSLEILTRVEHMTVFVASSDCGAFDIASEGGPYGQLSVDYPASDPWAVGVGGTMIALNLTTHSVQSLAETTWSDGSSRGACHNNWGSGGGLSQVFHRPSWQEGPGVHNRFSNGFRQLPDVSAYAFAVMDYFASHWSGAMGTSAATPIWASGMLLANEGLIRRIHGFFAGPQLFYAVAQFAASHHIQAYHDITAGNNLYYPATSGYDLATGFGSPNLPAFYNVLVEIAGSRS